MCHPKELAPAYTEHDVSCLNKMFLRQMKITFGKRFNWWPKSVWVGGRTDKPVDSVVKTANTEGKLSYYRHIGNNGVNA